MYTGAVSKLCKVYERDGGSKRLQKQKRTNHKLRNRDGGFQKTTSTNKRMDVGVGGLKLNKKTNQLTEPKMVKTAQQI